MAQDPRQTAQVRWLSAAQLIGVVRSEPGITRAAAAQRLGIGSGGATELVARMRQARLLDETPAPAQGRGRPTTVLGPHADGPLVLAADLRAADWRLALAGIDGVPQVVAQAGYAGERVGSGHCPTGKCDRRDLSAEIQAAQGNSGFGCGHRQRRQGWSSSRLAVGMTSTYRC